MVFTAALISLLSLGGAPVPQGIERFEAKLLKVGSQIPDVSVQLPGAKPAKLAGFFKGKKGGIVNFWFYH